MARKRKAAPRLKSSSSSSSSQSSDRDSVTSQVSEHIVSGTTGSQKSKTIRNDLKKGEGNGKKEKKDCMLICSKDGKGEGSKKNLLTKKPNKQYNVNRKTEGKVCDDEKLKNETEKPDSINVNRKIEGKVCDNETITNETEKPDSIDVMGVLVTAVCKENTVISTHVKFLKQMKGHVPKTEAFARLFKLIMTGPRLVNGQPFSDIPLMQTTVEFLIGLITDPSSSRELINIITQKIDDDFAPSHVKLLQQILYGPSNYFEQGFSIGLLNQAKQSVHLKYCVTYVMSNLFSVCFGKRFLTATSGSLGIMYNDNVFVRKLDEKYHEIGYLTLLKMYIQSYCRVLVMYGHVYYYDEEFLKVYWNGKYKSYYQKIGGTKGSNDLLKESFGTIQVMIDNLLRNLGNCITFVSWLHLMQRKVSASDLVDEISNALEAELNDAIDKISSIFANYVENRKKSNTMFVTEIKYSFVHNFGNKKLCNIKRMLEKALDVLERD
jgi:hypothetical protein